MRKPRSSDEEIEIGMSSLIDCVFLLLIFFLVSTMTKKENRDIDVDLPVSVSALDMPPDNNTMVIGINKEKDFFFNGRSVDQNELNQMLSEISDDNPDQRLRIDCDKATPFSRVVQVLDICAFRGMYNVGVRTYDEKYNSQP